MMPSTGLDPGDDPDALQDIPLSASLSCLTHSLESNNRRTVSKTRR